jgi:hypothetical protein
MSRAALIRSQLGIQTTPDTPVAATVQLPGLLTMRHAPERVLREEYRASWGGSNVHDDLKLESTGQYVGRCTASTLIYWLSAAMRGNPTVSGSGPYTWVLNQPLTGAIPDLKSLTAYWGNDTAGGGGGALRAPGVVATRIVIEGSDTAAWTIRVELLGMGAISGTFASLSTITNETIKNLLSSVYVASSWGALDALTNPLTEALLCFAYGFTWTWDSGITNDFAMNGSLNRCAINRGIPSVTLQLRAKWNADGAAQAVHTINGTRRFIRLENVGTANSTIKIAGAYDPMTYDTITDQRDGTIRSTWDLVGVEDTARKTEVTVINNVSAL